MTLLTIVQNAADRLGITRPSSVFTSTDQSTLRLLGYAQEEGKSLARRHSWQILTKEQTFTATATETQTSALPSDFDRWIDETFYNRTQKRPVYGPLNAQEWQFAKSVVATVIIESFRQRGSSTDILLTPTATAGETYAFEYIARNWCESSGGTDQAAWAADADVAFLEEELITLGVVWRFKSGQGLSYAEEFRNYELECLKAISKDGGKRTLNAGGSRRGRKPNAPFIQEGSWNL
jgi:hypothetical protein